MYNKRMRLRAKIDFAELKNSEPGKSVINIVYEHKEHYAVVKKEIDTPMEEKEIMLLPRLQRSKAIHSFIHKDVVAQVNEWTIKIDKLINESKF